MDGTAPDAGAQMRPALDDFDQLVAPLSDAEHCVAEALAGLGTGWTVYVQPRVGLDQPDFVAVHDQHGVCAIEVKDWEPGGVRRNEYCEFEVQYGEEWHRTVDQPRFEASRYRSTIFDQFYALPEDGGSPPPEIRAIVILPNFTTAEAVELLDDCVIHDGEELVAIVGTDDLGDRDALLAVMTGPADAPVPASMRRLREHIVVSEQVVVPESEAVPVSAGVIEMAVNPSDERIRRVRGAAGTGKTFGLAARAAQLAAAGDRVLVLSFNVTLANRLQQMVGDRCREVGANPTLVTACNFHSLCTRIVQDAEVAGYSMTSPPGAPWTVAIVAKVRQAFEQGFVRTYDAILVDEGQDFRSSWWTLLRERLLAPDGEMLVVADPTQDLYNRVGWMLREPSDDMTAPAEPTASADESDDPAPADDPASGDDHAPGNADAEQSAIGDDLGFGGWVDLVGGYRVPEDLTGFVNDLAGRSATGTRLVVEPARDHARITGGRATTSHRTWTDVERVNDLGRAVGREVVRLLQAHPSLSPGDIAFVCEYHHDGVAAVRVIERAGYPVHHIFSRDPDAPRRRRKHRFWPGADAVKGCTIHSFKGWETPALVVGVGADKRADSAAFVALTRSVAPDDGGPAIVSIVNANRGFVQYGPDFDSEPLPESNDVPGSSSVRPGGASEPAADPSSRPDAPARPADSPVPAYASTVATPSGSTAPTPAPAGGYLPAVGVGAASPIEPVPTDPVVPPPPSVLPEGLAPPASVSPGGVFAPPSASPVDLAPPPALAAVSDDSRPD